MVSEFVEGARVGCGLTLGKVNVTNSPYSVHRGHTIITREFDIMDGARLAKRWKVILAVGNVGACT